jgi:nitric oxide reductase subunit B
MMTMTQRIVYNFFAQVIILLMLYAALTLLGAAKFLGPDPLTSSLPFQKVGAFANVLLNLAILSGLLGGGIYIAADNNAPTNERLLILTFRLWTILLIAAFFAGLLGLLEGRHMLELPPVLDIAQAVILALAASNIVRSRSAFATVWSAGIIMSIVSTLTGLLPTTDYLQDRGFRVVAVGLNLNVAYVLAALAIGYWLIHRFSDVPQGWAESSLYTNAGLLAVAGILVSIPPLYTVGAPVQTLGSMGVVLVPIAYLIFAAHSYRALSQRNPTVTLAAQWYTLGLLLFLLGPGLLGALQTLSGQWTMGTRLTDLQSTLTSLAVVAVILGVVNQATAELRGKSQRVTGFVPFWLAAFGIIGGAIALGGAGLVQVYLERLLGVGYLESQTLLIPLYSLWLIGLLALALGIGVYALTFWLRRPTAN